MPVLAGACAGYQWLTSDLHTIGDIVRWCPEAIIGHYLAVSSTDSGEPRWWAEKLADWSCQGSVGYSPLLENFDGVRYQTDGPDSPGFDEWWTFEFPHVLGEVIQGENPWEERVMARSGRFLAFVNCYFYPDDRQAEHPLWSEFWEQIVKHQPESYISDGAEVVTFVSRNPSLFETVRAVFQDLAIAR